MSEPIVVSLLFTAGCVLLCGALGYAVDRRRFWVGGVVGLGLAAVILATAMAGIAFGPTINPHCPSGQTFVNGQIDAGPNDSVQVDECVDNTVLEAASHGK